MTTQTDDREARESNSQTVAGNTTKQTQIALIFADNLMIEALIRELESISIQGITILGSGTTIKQGLGFITMEAEIRPSSTIMVWLRTHPIIEDAIILHIAGESKRQTLSDLERSIGLNLGHHEEGERAC